MTEIHLVYKNYNKLVAVFLDKDEYERYMDEFGSDFDNPIGGETYEF